MHCWVKTTNFYKNSSVMKFIPLRSKMIFSWCYSSYSSCLRQNVECHAMPTQIDFVGDSSINHALIAVAQEVAELLQQAYPSQADRSLTHVQLQQAIDYIHTHLNRNLSLVKIAGVINISPTYFASLFKRATGISPHQYVIRQRVKRAKVMLAETDLAIADIALQVGFSSQSHLTQQFKCLTGMTPKQFALHHKNLTNRRMNLVAIEHWNSIHFRNRIVGYPISRLRR